jgi:DNA-binding CsgD family transcriptional regulator
VTALAVVTDPEGECGASNQVLMREFRLTPAEARVAGLLARGMAPKQIATSLGTSWNTVRIHLRRAYAKTRTRGQTELVRLLLTLGVGSTGSSRLA